MPLTTPAPDAPAHRARPRRRAGRRRATAIGAGVAALAAAAIAVPAAIAVTPPSGTGWVRLTHLSPDTPEVDVTVTGSGGDAASFNVDDVGYGAISGYTPLAPGTYTVAMRPAGADPATAPALSASIEVGSGQAITVAAYGVTAELQATVFRDDLESPAEGEGKVRVVQASTQTDAVTVSAGDTVVAEDAALGSASEYVELPAGETEFTLDGGDVEGADTVDIAGGSITTLFVLDDSSGGLVLSPVVDSASAEQVPADGGVDTGGGFFAFLGR